MLTKDKEIQNENDRNFQMLMLHNSKVSKIQNKYREECKLKIEAKLKGITYKELLAKQNEQNIVGVL